MLHNCCIFSSYSVFILKHSKKLFVIFKKMASAISNRTVLDLYVHCRLMHTPAVFCICKIHVFKWLPIIFQSPHHSYGGHSSHVTSVDFIPDDTRLISLGGRDCSIMQWALTWAWTKSPSVTMPAMYWLCCCRFIPRGQHE